MADDGIGNPIVVPSQNLVLDIPSDNLGVEGNELVETRSKATTAKKHNTDNKDDGLAEESEEQRRQPSQKKKKQKSRKNRKSRKDYDDEYRIHEDYHRDEIGSQEPHDATKDPVSMIGSSLYPLQEPVESRHGGSQRVRKPSNKKKSRRTHANQLENFDDGFNGFD